MPSWRSLSSWSLSSPRLYRIPARATLQRSSRRRPRRRVKHPARGSRTKVPQRLGALAPTQRLGALAPTQLGARAPTQHLGALAPEQRRAATLGSTSSTARTSTRPGHTGVPQRRPRVPPVRERQLEPVSVVHRQRREQPCPALAPPPGQRHLARRPRPHRACARRIRRRSVWRARFPRARNRRRSPPTLRSKGFRAPPSLREEKVHQRPRRT